MSEEQAVQVVIDATTAEARSDLDVYVTKHNLHVNNRLFAPGHRVQFTDPNQIAELRAWGAIALEEEVRAAEDLAEERRRAAAENAQLRDLVGQLEAQLVAAQTRNQQQALENLQQIKRGRGGRFAPAGITGSADNPGEPLPETPSGAPAADDGEDDGADSGD